MRNWRALDVGERREWKNWLKTQYSKNQDHGIWPHHFMSNRKGKVEAVTDIFLNSKITANCDCSHEIKRHLLLRWKATTNLDSILKSRDITLLTKVYIVKAMVFPIVMYWCKSWTIRKAEGQRTDAFELWSRRRLLESLVLQGDQTSQSLRKSTLNIHWKDWCEAKAPIFWPPDAKSQLIGKDPDAGKEWRQKEKRTAEDDLVRQHHRLNEHEFEQIPRDSEGQGSLACCSS